MPYGPVEAVETLARIAAQQARSVGGAVFPRGINLREYNTSERGEPHD
jgi:hypothetical protein